MTFRFETRWRSIAMATLTIAVAASLLQADETHFRERVAPVLQRRCLHCHNEREAKGKLSLATVADMLALGYIDPGSPDTSHLMELITPEDGRATMPKDAVPLAAAEIAAIRDWIAAGAAWPNDFKLAPPALADTQWWSLQPLTMPRIPVNSSDHPVDAFLAAKHAEVKLHVAPEADPVTLIRRLSYDLTGLPPRVEEVEAFVTDWSQDREAAWQRRVDRLLNDPGFGEKWGQHWLDIARYAETHGYDKDKPRMNAWPYRDYVVQSLNEDKSYIQFVQEQIAGDVLAGEGNLPGQPGTMSASGVVALGFLAAGPWDYIGHQEVGEGKLDGRIAKHLDRDEMITAVFNVFLSTTVQCAQCHAHKFDPISSEDYYRLHAVFAAVDRTNRSRGGRTPAQQSKTQAILAQIDALRQEEQQLQTKARQLLLPLVVEIDQKLRRLNDRRAGQPPHPQFGYHSRIEGTADQTKWVQVDLGEPQSLSQVRIVPAFDSFNNIGAGFGFPRRFRVESSNDPDFRIDVQTHLDATDKDQANPGAQPLVVDAGGVRARYLRITATRLAPRKNDFIFALGELEAISVAGSQNLAHHKQVTALDSIEQKPRWGAANLTDGIFHGQHDFPKLAAEIAQLEQQRQSIEDRTVPAEIRQRLAAIPGEIQQLNEQLAQFPPEEMVYAIATQFPRQGAFAPTGGTPRAIHLLHRGDLRQPGERLAPGAPRLWPEAKVRFASGDTWNEGEARASLAQYVTSHDNPLFWRSIVNRLWQWTFGSPLVGSPNDFGRMGLPPSHPELLDYLAAQLRDDPQHSLKRIVRLLVTSRAYRRASAHIAENAAIDGTNRWLWRANRRRLTAEEFRDTILTLAGALRREFGGPSFQDFVLQKPEHSPHYQYHLYNPDDPAGHRRSVYRFVVRSQPQPLFTTLDCADPSISVPLRDESTSALQALAQWNNRLVEMAARRFARQVAHADDPIAEALRRTTSRAPSGHELQALQEFSQEHGLENACRVILNLNALMYID